MIIIYQIDLSKQFKINSMEITNQKISKRKTKFKKLDHHL